MHIKEKYSNIYFIYAVLLTILPFRLGGITLQNDFVLALGLIFLFHLSISGKIKVDKSSLLFIGFGFIASFIFCLISLYNIANFSEIKDVVECFKPILFSFFVVAGYSAVSRGYLNTTKANNFFIKLIVISIIFSALLFFQEFNFITQIYKARTIDGGIENYNRFSGFFGYPSMFGVFSLLAFLLAVFSSWSMPTRVILFLGFIFTFSKTGFVLAAFIFFFLTFFKRINKLSIFIMLIVSLLSISIFWNELKDVINIFLSIDNLSESSFGHRLRELNDVYEMFKTENFIGFGPNNTNLTELYGPVESVYFYYGYKFGIFGLFYYFAICLFSLFILIRVKGTIAFIVALWAFLALTLGSAAESITEEYKTILIFPFILGGLYGYIIKSGGKNIV